MHPAWAAAWADRWRASLAAVGEVKMAALHVQTLQNFVVEDRDVVLPPLAAAQHRDAAPPPLPGDRLLLVRAGLLSYIQQVRQ